MSGLINKTHNKQRTFIYSQPLRKNLRNCERKIFGVLFNFENYLSTSRAENFSLKQKIKKEIIYIEFIIGVLIGQY
jgi:hypothetical protein